MRAQASLEFLILLAAFLSFLALLLPAINGLQKASQERLDAELAFLAANDIANAASEVCQSGAGSEREVEVRLGRAASIYGDGELVIVDLSASRSFARADCIVSGSVEVDGAARVRAKNSGGRAVLS